MALKTFSSSGTSETQTTFFQVFGAYHYIHKAVQGGVNVVAVNNSWGGPNYSTIYDKLLDLVGEEGVISYLAASNNGANNERTRTCPANSESDFAVSVGAAGIEGSRAIFSNYEKTSVDVFGPGVSVLSSVASDVYAPGLYDAEKLNATTEYYGEFGADVKVIDGSVTPSTGARAGDEIKSFGSLKFIKQRSLPEDDDREIPDDAALELSVENGRLKLTVKNAHRGEYYYVYFPYEKNPLTTGDDNTAFSLIAEGIPAGDGSVTNAFAGEVAETENGFDFTNDYAFVTSTEAFYTHQRNNATNNGIECLLSAEKAEGLELGIGLCICADWEDTEETHDTSYYIDSVAVSKPGYEIEPGTSYNFMSGTSMATPAVYGAGALLTTIYPRQENESVWCFDGKKWEQKRDDLKYVGRINDTDGTLSHSDAITPVKNGLLFIDASVDGGGNMFLYNTETDDIEPLYYSGFDSLSDAFDQNHSCVTTRDGIYYLCNNMEENDHISGWRLCLLPAESGVYENPYESEIILGDADGDGSVTILDVTELQRSRYPCDGSDKSAQRNRAA